MATITVRNLDPQTVEHLKQRAKANGRSLEAEVRRLLDQAVRAPERRGELADLVASLDLETVRRGIHPAKPGPRPPRAPVTDWAPGRSLSDDVIASRERFA